MTNLSCFKAYDIRGELDVSIDEGIVYRISRATSQHFAAKSVVVGFDARKTSPTFASAAAKAIRDSGSDVINIGLSGTEEMYWAVSEFGACAGIVITASHNPINYNGMKIVKSQSRPLNQETDLKVIKRLAEKEKFSFAKMRGKMIDSCFMARTAYIDRVISFTDFKTFMPLKIVVNSGNGAAGPTFDAIAQRLSTANVPLDFIRINHTPDHTFPNGIPNPLLPKNHGATAKVVRDVNADFGIAFDGDFDRCFFFDGNGRFVEGEFIVGLLADIFLQKESGAKIVHDPRVVWNIQDIVDRNNGVAVQSKTGHAFIKQKMRAHQAIYGGEMSAHHYFRDFAYCDSGMIPWLLVAELVSKSGVPLADLVSNRFSLFPSSGETNFYVKNVGEAIDRVVAAYCKQAISFDSIDGVSMVFSNWRLNLRGSNTEPLLRLNIEFRGGSNEIQARVADIAKIIGGTIV